MGQDPFKLRPLVAPVAATLTLVAGIIGARAALRVPAGDPAPYLAAVRAEAEALPMHVGLWFGHDVPVPTQATDLLKPNAIVSRQYEHLTTGRRVTLLLVQTRDARDLLGHFPPICYPSRGFVMTASEPEPLALPRAGARGGNLAVPAMRYCFSLTSAGGGEQAIEVVNFMLSPDGGVEPDMYALERHLTDRRWTHYGAAQVQLVFPGGVDPAERDGATRQFLEVMRPAITAILGGYAPG